MAKVKFFKESEAERSAEVVGTKIQVAIGGL